MQRREKEQRIVQIYTQISVIMGNWKNRLKSHGVPLSAIWPGLRETSKTKVTPKRNTKTMWEKESIFIYRSTQFNRVIFNWKIIKVNFQTMPIYLENIVILWILDITALYGYACFIIKGPLHLDLSFPVNKWSREL